MAPIIISKDNLLIDMFHFFHYSIVLYIQSFLVNAQLDISSQQNQTKGG